MAERIHFSRWLPVKPEQLKGFFEVVGAYDRQVPLQMTVTIQLSDEQAAAVQAQAANDGLTINAWLQRLAEESAQRPKPSSMQKRNERPYGK